MGLLTSLLPTPVLWPMDNNGDWLPIRFQFIPGTFTMDVKSNYAEASSLGRDQPLLQFVRGEIDTFTFEAKLFSQSVIQEVNSLLALLKRATKKDDRLGRPPIWMFIYGSIVQEQVVIESLGGIKIGMLRPDSLLRMADLTVVLKKYTPFDVAITGIDQNAGNTSLIKTIAKAGALWEGVALASYASAALGPILAQRQGTSTPPAGAVALPPKTEMLKAQLQPQAPPLQRTDAGIAAVSNIFAARNAVVKVSTVLTRGG